MLSRSLLVVLLILPMILSSRPAVQGPHSQQQTTYWMGRAKTHSDEAKNGVLSYFGTLKSALAGSGFENYSASKLLEHFTAEFSAAAVTRNIKPQQLDIYANLTYNANFWEMTYYQHNNITAPLEDAAETKIIGYPEFAKPGWPKWEEAIDRPTYWAVNLWKNPVACNGYGNIVMVMNPHFYDKTVVVPMDSGNYVKECIDKNDTKSSHCASFVSKQLGTMYHFYHLESPHGHFYNYSMAELFQRWAFKRPAENQTYRYFEAVFLGNMYLPDGISYLIADLELYGTTEGTNIRRHASNFKRPLVWATQKGNGAAFIDANVKNIAGTYVPTGGDAAIQDKYWKSNPNVEELLGALKKEVHFYFLAAKDVGKCVLSSSKIMMGTNGMGGCTYWS